MLKAISSVAAGESGRALRSDRLRSLLDPRYLVALTAVATYALIVLGGTVRATDSGLACPDWPRCHGQLIPPLETHVLIEYSHRLAAVAVGLLIAGTAATAWLWYRQYRGLLAGVTAALVLVIVQALVGGVTVNMELPSTIVAVHLGIALTLLAVLVATAADAFRLGRREAAGPAPGNPRSSLRAFALPGSAVLATFALIMLGSYVANEGAGLAYPDWPLFNGKVASSGGRLADLHYAHRLMAVVAGLLILAVLARLLGGERRPVPLVAMGLALVLYVAQVLVGASNVWFDLATSLRVAHLALASALWATLVLALAWWYLEAPPAMGKA